VLQQRIKIMERKIDLLTSKTVILKDRLPDAQVSIIRLK
jgi:hypothetical protein